MRVRNPEKGHSQRREIDGLKGRGERASFAVFDDFWLDARSSTSLWFQLYQQLRQAIISRRLPSGTRLPATRLFAEELGCSRNTILGAFEQLIAEGYLEGRIGSGTYVSDMLCIATPLSPDQALRSDGKIRQARGEGSSARVAA